MKKEEICKANRDQKAQQYPTEWQGYSIAFHLLLPIAGFLILWGRRDLFNKLLLQVDRGCVSVFCPSFSQRQKLLRWVVENLPSTWSISSKNLNGGIQDLWKDGSLLCTLINMAIPGACQNPPKHWKKPPTHAQALAYKYFGISPVFSESDFEKLLTPKEERRFLLYLQDLQHAIKSHGVRETAEKFTHKYLAKGMGLHNSEQHRKTIFYVYSNSTNSNCSNVMIYIRGPYGTQGSATIPAFYNRRSDSLLSSLHRHPRSMDKIVFKKEARKSFLMSIASDISSLVNRKSVSNDIPILVEMEADRARVSYLPLNSGIYEISLITNGELLINSPYAVSVSENNSGTKETLDENEKLQQELPMTRKRKIVARFIDCINEKILLDHEGSDALSTTDESGFGNQMESTLSDVSVSPDVKEELISNLKDDSNDESEDESNQMKFIKTVKFADDNIEGVVPTLSKTEHIEAEKSFSEVGLCGVFLGNLKSPKIFDYCHVDSTTPIDSLEIYDHLQATAEPSTIHGFDPPPPTNPDNSSSPPKSNLSVKTSDDDQQNLETNASKEGNDVSAKFSETEDRMQKRPTSIVTPFLITPNLVEKSNSKSQEDERNDNNTKIEVTNEVDYPHYNINEIGDKRKNNYVERLKTILINKFTESENTKTIKNLVNSTNKLKRMKKLHHQQDQNNNSFHITTLRATSPICTAHIVPEVEKANNVEYETATVSEKRKLLTKQTCVSLTSSNNSSFSEKENEDVAKESDENKYKLKLLSFIDTIRNSTNSSLSRTISNSSPNISISKSFNSLGSYSEGSMRSRTSFVEAREYWLNLSTENCSIGSINHQKPNITTPKQLDNSIKTSCDKYRSAEDITSFSRRNFSRRLAKCSSLNERDFEAIDFISLDERKKMLLQDQYETEKMATRYINRNIFYKKKCGDMNRETVNLENTDTENSTNIAVHEEECSKISENSPNNMQIKSCELKTLTPFKTAFTFFRNLEKSNCHKLPLKAKPLIKRRFSLDCIEKKREVTKLGGSLRVSKVSDKFQVSKFYFDIMENKRGSFKGIPNREALFNSLASLSAKTNEILDNSNDPIQYNVFMSKARTRKRKSLKSIFNILH
ncbi:uncharacterized protein LOC123318716 isoform X2 [Coccinella septempunctata]|uniref:uncharacterized protein LOC123318716 isoform X2 n=1 Tax=Coccinella septempunctata TaxID=41139 RepID=UPI001D074236|nr:uncharacterized protein LOC123318716 isoform X2 [Coccinella septempunctata]